MWKVCLSFIFSVPPPWPWLDDQTWKPSLGKDTRQKFTRQPHSTSLHMSKARFSAPGCCVCRASAWTKIEDVLVVFGGLGYGQFLFSF